MAIPGELTLRDGASGSTAAVLPAVGFNCFSFRPVVGGAPVEALWAAPDFGTPEARPTRSGIPLLFPFAGRLRGSTFAFGDRTYGLKDSLFNAGNAIHGFVLNRPWRVTEQAAARATGEFHASVDEPGLLEQWPADFRIAVTYEVAGTALRCEVRVDNPDERPLPFGLGTHPYFRVPLGEGDAAGCRVTVPAGAYWELADGLPTGRRFPATGERDLTAGLPFGDAQLDDVLTDLRAEDGRVRTAIVDPGSGRTLTQTFDAAFRHCVVFTPPHRQAVCVEPYTAVPDAFALEAAGVETGLRVLAPGESFTGRIEIRFD